jgi:hypothetical protein
VNRRIPVFLILIIKATQETDKMSWIEQFLGMGFVVIGLLSVTSYNDSLAGFRINWFHKELRPMQERWGVMTGTVLHILEYVVAPLGFGILFLMGVVL